MRYSGGKVSYFTCEWDKELIVGRDEDDEEDDGEDGERGRWDVERFGDACVHGHTLLDGEGLELG